MDDTKGLGVDAIMKETVPTRGDFRLVVESFVGALNVCNMRLT